jgi:excisionase family DNA binding protein
MEHDRIQFTTRANAALTERSREIRIDENTPESQHNFRSTEEPAPPQQETDASENLTEEMIGASDWFALTDMDSRPMTVRDAAKFLGVSQQTVYLWVERKHIPHLRVMGRNIRFLKSDLVSFRASFRQEMEHA